MISGDNTYVEIACDGSENEFSYPYKLFDKDNITVQRYDGDSEAWETLSDTAYEVTENSGDALNFGVTVETDTIYDTGDKIRIIRNEPLTQLTDYTTTGSFDPQTAENALDKLTILIQQINYKIDNL